MGNSPVAVLFRRERCSHEKALVLLKRLRERGKMQEEKKCYWNVPTTNAASFLGDLEMLKYCVENGCPVVADACEIAAKCGHLECLKYLHEEAKLPLSQRTGIRVGILERARINRQIECLRSLIDKKCPGWEECVDKLKELEIQRGKL